MNKNTITRKKIVSLWRPNRLFPPSFTLSVMPGISSQEGEAKKKNPKNTHGEERDHCRRVSPHCIDFPLEAAKRWSRASPHHVANSDALSLFLLLPALILPVPPSPPPVFTLECHLIFCYPLRRRGVVLCGAVSLQLCVLLLWRGELLSSEDRPESAVICASYLRRKGYFFELAVFSVSFVPVCMDRVHVGVWGKRG